MLLLSVHGMQEARGSNPLSSIQNDTAQRLVKTGLAPLSLHRIVHIPVKTEPPLTNQ